MHSIPAGSFARLSSPEALWQAYLRYRRGKRRTHAVASFDLDADLHVLELSAELRRGRYRPGPYRLDVVHDPKVRLIAAAPVRDRVVHQALVAELAPHYERGFIHDNYASQSGRGPHRAVLRYLAWTRRHAFRLSLDVRRYFPSVDHAILARLLFRRLADARTRALIESTLVEGGKVYESELARRVMRLEQEPLRPRSGMPIGSYFSQWCGALYLDAFDHFVKRELKVAAYLRYCDDLVLFAGEPPALEQAFETITDWLERERALTIRPKGGGVRPTTEPSTFLGYRVSRGGILPGPKLKRRMRSRLRAAAARGPQALARSVRSYAGSLDWR
ncbi:MAG TPA: reverse transcriptase domain-containing protein [Polyangiaceae bacterium]